MDVSKKITTILEGMKMKNYTKISVGQDARTELHDQLGLTGAEISVNNLPAGAGVPFVHYHHKNEEIYMILRGGGFRDQLHLHPGQGEFPGRVHGCRRDDRAVSCFDRASSNQASSYRNERRILESFKLRLRFSGIIESSSS